MLLMHHGRACRPSTRCASRYDAKTSCLPFVALLTGAQNWSDLAPEIKMINAACGIIVALAVAVRRRSAIRALPKVKR